MWLSEPRKVLVAVESPDCDAALQFAVEESTRRGCGIHLAHVAHPALADACALDDICLVNGELRSGDLRVLQAAESRVRMLLSEHETGDDLPVSTELLHGPVVPMLAELSRQACCVVVEHHRRGPAIATLPFSATAAVIAVARCPVVVVRPAWQPGSGDETVVVVGVKDPARAGVLLAVADREAIRRGVRLRVVLIHDAADPSPEVSGMRPTQSPTDLVVRAGDPAELLVEESRGAGLLVVGRPRSERVARRSVGHTVRTLLAACEVPLLLIDSETEPDHDPHFGPSATVTRSAEARP